jgi:hypothetical protein
MPVSFRHVALFLALAPCPLAASTPSGMIERFDAAVARLQTTGMSPPEEALRTRRSAADFVLDRALKIELMFPGDVTGTMFSGQLHGEPAVFTRSGNYLDATSLRAGEIAVTSFDAPVDDASLPRAEASSTRGGDARHRRSVPPGHKENPTAYRLHLHVVKHDDLINKSVRELHSRYVAWWLADLSARVLPVEPVRVSYLERVPWLTSMAYGDTDSLHAFERTLKALDSHYEFGMERTFKKKFLLLTAQRPMPGTTGVAFEGGNEAIASIAGRTRIVAHEIGHMLGATHAHAERRGWWGCETNMAARGSSFSSDCLEYSAANQRAMRSYMRHGPDTTGPKRMADAPAAE